MEKYFFDLPVYRIGKEQYYQWKDRKIEEHLSSWKELGMEVPEHVRLQADEHLYKKYGPWDFNEIIGYIRLHFLGSQVRGEYFSAEKKRNSAGRTKVFTYQTHKLAAEVNLWFGTPPTNAQIWEGIQSYIDRCQKELVRGRVIDASKLLALGPHIDWLSYLRMPQK
ncbi:hypothetical protein BWR17_02780 [Phaeobacter inhibens]|uniref:hypothetical protein n=1 Tax=Phaeobacter inhibens TaxID=221822 RepID=UPI0009718F8D|nr:hypothetical protein [Phaeobacter inhibens]APX14877.1 hypothetical protein BWR17_02780 [Phaeobacter inhibens]